jgi:hypothetical protein
MFIEDVTQLCGEARDRLRLYYSAPIETWGSDRKIISGRLRDIGIESLYLYAEGQETTDLIYGETVSVKIRMESGKSTLTIEFDACVERMDEEGFFLRFTQPLKWWPVFLIFSNPDCH